MTGDRTTARLRLAPAAAADPPSRMLADLPPGWHGEVIGPGIEGWESMAEAGRDRALRLEGLPAWLRLELAWMAHWQHRDGLKVSVNVCNQLASLLAWAPGAGHMLPQSLAWADKQDLLRLHGTWFHARHGRLPAAAGGRRAKLERLLGYPRLALAARLHDGAWWELDTWHPRCDPRIPLRPREPCRSVGCSPGEARLPWVKNAIKWHLSVLLESGALTWSTLTCQRSPALLRFARWLESLAEPAAAIGDPQQAGVFAAAFRRWAGDPAHRSSAGRPPAAVSAGKVNLDLWSAAGLMAFLTDHRQEAGQILGPSPWDELTDVHPAIWLRQRTRIRRRELLTDETRYVDDHALAQITACLSALGEPADRTITVTTGGSTRVLPGQDDPQLMRMLLLQILTGRRASEICLCPFDCLSPAASSAAGGDAVARFRYGQSKIDAAPDTILVDAETVAVIEEQQRWLRRCFPGRDLPHLFPQRRANAHGAKPYGNSNYGRALAQFSELAQITDSAGHPVKLSHTHRFRHTRLTKLAELGLPVHVLQRYAGHYAGDLVKLIMLGDCLVEAGQQSVEDFLAPGLALGGGVVALLFEGGAELDGGLEERARFADGLEVAVQADGAGAVAVAEHPLVHFGAEFAHLGALGAGGQVLRGVVEGLDLLRHREVFLGHGAVGDAGIHHGHPHRSMAEKGGYRLEAHAPVDGLGGQRVPEPVRADVADPGGAGGLGDGPVDAALPDALAVLGEQVRGAQAGGPCGEPGVEEVFELGVQRDVAVGAELAERHVEPVGGADLHDGVDGEVEELAFAQAGAGQEFHGQADERVGVGAGGLQQLGERAVVQEAGQRLVAQRQVAGEHQHRGGDVAAVPLGEPLEAGAQGAEVLGEADLGQFPAAGRWPAGQVQLVGLDVAAAKVGDAGRPLGRCRPASRRTRAARPRRAPWSRLAATGAPGRCSRPGWTPAAAAPMPTARPVQPSGQGWSCGERCRARRGGTRWSAIRTVPR